MILRFLIKNRSYLIYFGIILLIYLAFEIYISSRVEDARHKDAMIAIEKDRRGDEAALVKFSSESEKTQRENEDARHSANLSSDPLKSGLDGLRAAKD